MSRSARTRRHASRSLAVLIAAILALLPASAPAAQFPGKNGKIGYIKNKQIRWMKPSGTQDRVIKRLKFYPQDIVFSPNGKQLVFDYNDSYILKVNTDGSGLQRLTPKKTALEEGASYNPTWSPNGKKIAFTRWDGVQADIWVMRADGKKKKNLTGHVGQDDDASWSPDGSKIAFVSGRNGTFDVFTMNPNGSDQASLGAQGLNERYPQWSPNGAKLVYNHNSDGADLEIWVMDSNGGNRIRLTTNAESDQKPIWSPSGNKILYSSTQDGGGFMTMGPTGLDPQQILPGNVYSPAWQPA